jgi:hypothetical protein
MGAKRSRLRQFVTSKQSVTISGIAPAMKRSNADRHRGWFSRADRRVMQSSIRSMSRVENT